MEERTMKKVLVIRHHHEESNEAERNHSELSHSLPYEKAANALMNASGYASYVSKHGYHFTKKLATMASDRMRNVDGSGHSWTVDEIRAATNNVVIPKGTTIGDVLYLANMAYADFYPRVLKTEESCVQYALAVANDPDGYEGMAFCRWTADLIGTGATIDWEKLE